MDNIINKSKIETLIVFSIDICKRLIDDYVDFYIKYNWGNPNILNEAIKYCEETEFAKIDRVKVKELIHKVEKITPDTEDFENIEVSYALNSACAVLELLEFIMGHDKIHVSNISSFIIDTIDFKIQEIESGLTNDEIEDHPKIVEERKRQIAFLIINDA
ncbi:DUF416 family protein [Flavobacterium hungaricum]|uniref:DUF416 family protein n=1 Tax=Flavobacterium hungaricum TaxID=2082725 RepID=A0ABR9TS21_9FLAO|nr:DUF416 family protein [Flavobacterium hungaricum]MBE8728116.1 DUF416 family protein [Flavobacterium hungaricum]